MTITIGEMVTAALEAEKAGYTDEDSARDFAAGVRRHDGTELNEQEREAVMGAWVLYIHEKDPADTAAFYDRYGVATEPVRFTPREGRMAGVGVEVVMPTWLAGVICGQPPSPSAEVSDAR